MDLRQMRSSRGLWAALGPLSPRSSGRNGLAGTALSSFLVCECAALT